MQVPRKLGVHAHELLSDLGDRGRHASGCELLRRPRDRGRVSSPPSTEKAWLFQAQPAENLGSGRARHGPRCERSSAGSHTKCLSQKLLRTVGGGRGVIKDGPAGGSISTSPAKLRRACQEDGQHFRSCLGGMVSCVAEPLSAASQCENLQHRRNCRLQAVASNQATAKSSITKGKSESRCCGWAASPGE